MERLCVDRLDSGAHAAVAVMECIAPVALGYLGCESEVHFNEIYSLYSIVMTNLPVCLECSTQPVTV